MKAQIITLFPDMFPGPLGQSLAGRALEDGKWQLETINPRDFATDLHKTVDDTPYGGGAGMVMKAETISQAIESLNEKSEILYMSPRGTPLSQTLVKELVQKPVLTILCGRYEGVDERVLNSYNIREISVGDYVLSGGEIAALTMLDACVRLLPGVMGNDETAGEESFENGLLEYPHYTKPAVWEDPKGDIHEVPEILRSGHHANIVKWRLEQAEKITRERRPDLWEQYIKRKN